MGHEKMRGLCLLYFRKAIRSGWLCRLCAREVIDWLRSEMTVIVGWLVIERQRRTYLEASFV